MLLKIWLILHEKLLHLSSSGIIYSLYTIRIINEKYPKLENDTKTLFPYQAQELILRSNYSNSIYKINTHIVRKECMANKFDKLDNQSSGLPCFLHEYVCI